VVYDKWLQPIEAAEPPHDFAPAGQDDLVLEPGLVSLRRHRAEKDGGLGSGWKKEIDREGKMMGREGKR